MNKKMGWLAVLACFLVPASQAQQWSPYVGGYASYYAGQLSYDWEYDDGYHHDSDEFSLDYSGYAFGLNAGAELKSGPMIELQYSRTSQKSDKATQRSVYYGSELQMKMPLGTGAGRPYAGFGLGTWVHADSKKYRDDADRDIVGVSLSLLLGAIVKTSDTFYLDSGLRLRSRWWEEYEWSDNKYNDSELMAELYLGAQVRF
ncbi:hypothetical protein GCM10011297_31260 [Bacterioplanes sanyensis]|uniref:outer membrane beta-barrel protein n=1 Tax=Bacterioplanes sanyensis TaxID=1249553 RepID=UPI0016728CD7|nr:outer membrane beta-barrel protein [Bacterioplanes sanyensis]GGY56234.1 hypothetical protein GCM10011297_31260 [Bacterioplanes sanyensis]